MVRRLDLANRFFVAHALRIHQRLVQVEQREAKFGQAPPKILVLRRKVS